MKASILIVLCLSSAAASAPRQAKDFAPTLPNGITVELVGVCFHSSGSDHSAPRQWWKPDGSDLDDEPFRAFDTMADYRRWCEASLPNWLGYGRL